ncbi:MAG: glucose-6-phosphate dehydrogenase [bacterium]
MNPTNPTSPTIFVIIGITGDLAQRKLLPALLSLYVKKLLPQKFAVVGFSRRHFSREEFRMHIRENMHVRPGQYREEEIKHFLDHMSYEQGFFDNESSYHLLAQRLATIDEGFHQCSNKLFHLAVSPSFYEIILDHLAKSGLTVPCDDNLGWTRVLVEKPFGNDVETAEKLDAKLAKLFKEEQIFRIDHYLAKEALQNILSFRFANTLFEPLWNRVNIDKVHIKLLEKADVEGRGTFYDSVGALKDVGQNHLLQMLALVAMEKPRVLDASGIRKERAKILAALRPITKKTVNKLALRAQYEGYSKEPGVKAGSQTETYFRLEAQINNSRWKNVPFFLESGKAMAESRCEINVYFKSTHHKTRFSMLGGGTAPVTTTVGNSVLDRQNVLTFKIQPDEGIKIRFWVKKPGFTMDVEPKMLKFKYLEAGSADPLPDAYEHVLYDAILGDQTLFTSTPEVLAAWKFITPIVAAWHTTAQASTFATPLTLYKKGSKEV